MKNIPAPLFNELISQSARIAVGWLVVRTDGTRYGFTSSDFEFDYNGDTYTPSNGFNASAIVSKADASVDNLEAQVLESDSITESDLRGGVWNNAQINVFWICPYHPEWGVVPLRGGILGEVTLKEGQFTTQLRSMFQQLQQPFGFYYRLQCEAELGDARCKVNLAPPTWAASTAYNEGLLTDASIGSIVKPTVPNDYWYVANYTTETFQALEAGYGGDVYLGVGGGGGGGGTETGGLTDFPGVTGNTVGVSAADNIRSPSAPGQGLSANDDMGPNDQTQVAVGAPPDDLSQFNYTGTPVDIFGIKI